MFLYNIKKRFLKELESFPNLDKIYVAFSGGADSIFLTELFIISGIEVELLYLNHNLRGKESEEEESFVKSYAKSRGLKLTIRSEDVKGYSLKNRKGIEESARELRYSFFSEYSRVATAHHLDDNVETFIFRLVRGSSLDGLKSIPKERDNIIRPILNFTKDEILKYLKERDIEYFEDSSNSKNIYTRNRIRNEIIPLLEEISPKAKEKIAKTIEDLNSLESSCSVKEGLDKLGLENVKRTHIELLKERDNISIDIDGRRISKVYGEIKEIDISNISSDIEKELSLGDNYFNSYTINLEKTNEEPYFNKKDTFFVDDSLKLTVRSRLAGDRFKPFGSSVTKKLKSYFIDNKIDRDIRSQIPIICSSGKVVWIAGFRGSEEFRPKSSSLIKLTLTKALNKC